MTECVSNNEESDSYRVTKDIRETFDPKDIKDFWYSKEMRNTKDIMETKNIRDAKRYPEIPVGLTSGNLFVHCLGD